MPKPAFFVVTLFFLLGAFSCRPEDKTERGETAYWNNRVIDTTFRLLYSDEDTTRAFRLFDSVLNVSRTADIYPRATRIMMAANYHYFFTDKNQRTAALIDSALALINTPELQARYPRLCVGYLLFGGDIAYRIKQYNKANEYYFRAKKIGDAHLDPCERKAFHYSIAMVLYRQKNFRQSKAYFQQAYRLQETCSPQTKAVVLQQQEIQSNIGLCFTQLKQYDSADVYFDRALAIAVKNKDSLEPKVMDKIIGVVYGHKGLVAMGRGRLALAAQLTQKSVALNDREDYEREHARRMKLQLAEIYYRLNELPSMAGVLANMATTIPLSDRKMQMEWKRLKGTYFEKTAHADSALAYFRGFHALQDADDEEQASLTAADVARQLRDKEQALQIIMLKKDKHITVISLWVTIIVSCMAMAILYLIYQNYRRSKSSLALSLALNEEIRRQKNARVAEAKQRHKLITEAVIQAQESERSLIGLELHDNINQVLTTVKLHNEMLLEGIGEPKVILPRTLLYLQNCINEIRSLSKRLSAPTLGKISLDESIKDLIESIHLTSKVKITQDFTGFETRYLGQAQHIGIYRIVQEQLNNVLKHSDATRVCIRLSSLHNQLHLSITDNGKGFVVDNSRNGIGLMNMQTRAENLGGTFDVKSKPGEGCQVSVVVPCSPETICN